METPSVILFCPGGRKSVLNVQLKYLVKLLDLNIIHEYHIWNFSWNENDSEYISTLHELHPKIKIKYSPYANAERAGDIESKQFSYFLHDYYQYEEYKDYIFVKLDDDIVFIDNKQFEKFIEGRLKSNSFLYSANVINNDYLNPTNFCNIHNDFLNNYSHILEKNNKKGIEYFSNEKRLSINLVSFLGKDLKYINEEFSNGIGSNDEWRLCHTIPKKLGRDNEICLYMTIVHYAFGGHIDGMYIDRYLQLFENLYSNHNNDNNENDNKAKVCFITAIYGNYETSCKKFAKQTIPTDFICFTNNPRITNNGWVIDTTPYHLENKSPLDNDTYVNSLTNNKHTFNIAKYYKQAFQNIPRLKEYDLIVWLDGTIELTNEKVSEYLLENIYEKKMIGWHHEHRNNDFHLEVIMSHGGPRYDSNYWLGQYQPIQDLDKQYEEYLKDGYTNDYFKKMNPTNDPHFGIWMTCFIAFLNKDKSVSDFLDMWYLQTLKYTTQDQVGFPYVCQKLHMTPYTLPNDEIKGKPHSSTDFYIRHLHGL